MLIVCLPDITHNGYMHIHQARAMTHAVTSAGTPGRVYKRSRACERCTTPRLRVRPSSYECTNCCDEMGLGLGRLQASIGGLLATIIPRARIVPAVKGEDMSTDPQAVGASGLFVLLTVSFRSLA